MCRIKLGGLRVVLPCLRLLADSVGAGADVIEAPTAAILGEVAGFEFAAAIVKLSPPAIQPILGGSALTVLIHVPIAGDCERRAKELVKELENSL